VIHASLKSLSPGRDSGPRRDETFTLSCRNPIKVEFVSEEGSVEVLLPPALREYSGGEEVVKVDAKNVAEAILRLDERFRGLGDRILDDGGRVRRHVHVFVNEESVGQADPRDVALKPGDRVHILPAVSGG
jgi:molybdopterin converting factor small subunit